jgi:hypothetical protein
MLKSTRRLKPQNIDINIKRDDPKPTYNGSMYYTTILCIRIIIPTTHITMGFCTVEVISSRVSHHPV